jgi:hypothetical protein
LRRTWVARVKWTAKQKKEEERTDRPSQSRAGGRAGVRGCRACPPGLGRKLGTILRDGYAIELYTCHALFNQSARAWISPRTTCARAWLLCFNAPLRFLRGSISRLFKEIKVQHKLTNQLI